MVLRVTDQGGRLHIIYYEDKIEEIVNNIEA